MKKKTLKLAIIMYCTISIVISAQSISPLAIGNGSSIPGIYMSRDPQDSGHHIVRGWIEDIEPWNNEPGAYIIEIDTNNDGTVDHSWIFYDVDTEELAILENAGQNRVKIEYHIEEGGRYMDSADLD